MAGFSYIIVEDEMASVMELKHLMDTYAPDFSCIGEANNIEDASKLFSLQKPTLAFLDIDISGENIFSILPNVNTKDVNLVFTTAHEGYVLQALRISAVDYLHKPIELLDFLSALKKIRNITSTTLLNTSEQKLEILIQNLNNSTKSHKIAIPYSKGFIFRNISELVYVKASVNYCELNFVDSKKYTLTKTLAEQENLLSGYNFLRIHQSYLVNLNYFENFNSEDLILTLSNNFTLPVSTRRKSFLIDKLKSTI